MTPPPLFHIFVDFKQAFGDTYDVYKGKKLLIEQKLKLDPTYEVGGRSYKVYCLSEAIDMLFKSDPFNQ